MLHRQPHPDRPAPVLDDDGQPLEPQRLDETEDGTVVPVERVPVAVGRLVRPAEAEVVGSDDARRARQAGDHLPVEVRPRRLAVQAEHGIALTLVDVVHPQPVLVRVSGLEREVGDRREAFVGRAVDVGHRGPGTPRNS